MRKTLQVGVAITCIALSAVFVAFGQSKDSSADVADAQRAALRKGGLRAAAAVTGSYMDVLDFSSEAGPTSLEDLVRGSRTILVGRVLKNYSVLPPMGAMIRTEYTVRVTELLKGDVSRQGRDTVTISVLGGRVSFPEGTQAQQTVRNTNPPIDGRRYLFFLIDIPSDAKTGPKAVEVSDADFWPLRGSYGFFELPDNGSGVKPGHRRPTGGGPSQEYTGVYSESFLLDVRQEIASQTRPKR